MLWELVAGALIEGVAEPRAQVLVELKLLSSARHAPVSYRAMVLADAEGSYQVRVPYPTGGGGNVLTSFAYRIYSRGSEAALQVSEAAVAGGERVAGPRLTAGR